MNRMQAERQALERGKADKSANFIAEYVGANQWTVKRYPRIIRKSIK